MMICSRVSLVLLAVLVTQAPSKAQTPDTIITFAGVRTPACAVSTDPAYGLTAAKPIQLGGGPSQAGARMSRFLGALRGPNGESLIISSRGSMVAPFGYMDEPTILDSYQIAMGDQKISLFVDEYHYGIPKAPMGLTCAGPLVIALGPPPIEPLSMNRSVVRLAIEKGSTREIPAVPLDVSTPRGFLFDQFAMIAQRAKAAADAGMPMDPAKPPAGMDPSAFVVLAFPVPCADRTLLPQRIELSTPQGPIPQNGADIKGEPLVAMFPSMKVPPGSIAARFRMASISGMKIAYSEGCNATPAEVSLLPRVDAPRPPLRALPLPAGVVEAEPAVFLQVILDPTGVFGSVEYVGGPKSLVPAAMEFVRNIRTEPLRLNGVGIYNPGVIPVVFQR